MSPRSQPCSCRHRHIETGGKPNPGCDPDVLHCPLLAVDVGGRDVGFLAFAVSEDAGLWLEALGLHVRGRLGDGQQFRHLPGDTLRGLLVQPLLLGGRPEEEILFAKTSGYGFLCTHGDLLSRQRASKAFLTVEDGASILPPVRVAGKDHLAALSEDGRLADLPAPPDEAPRERQGRADHQPA